MICQACKENIKDGAIKCIHCNSTLNEQGQVINTEKQKELYQILKSETRFRQDILCKKDDKANKYMILLTVIFGLVSFVVKCAIEDLPKNNDFSIVILIIFFISVISFALTIFSLLRVLKGLEIKLMKYDDEEVKLFNSIKLFDYLNRLNLWFKEEFAETEKQIHIKDKKLRLSHNLMSLTLILTTVTVILSYVAIVQHNNLKGGNRVMADDNSTVNATPDTTQNVVQAAPVSPIVTIEAAPAQVTQPVNSTVHMFSEHSAKKEER